MITERQQDRAELYALGSLPEDQLVDFETELRSSLELRDWVAGLQRAVLAVAWSAPAVPLPPGLKATVLARVQAAAGPKVPAGPLPGADAGFGWGGTVALAGMSFLAGAARRDWKALPIPGAYIKLLSLEQERGYAVLMGKLEPGTRYPEHINVGPEDFYILSGDLYIGDTRLDAGDFHHAEKGSRHPENHSREGCVLLAVLTTEDPLVAFALG